MPRWSVRCGSNYSLQKQKLCNRTFNYIRFALLFADMQIPELVTVFNTQVQNQSWASMRAYNNQALIDEFIRRNIDVSSVFDGKALSFAHPVKYDLKENKLILINNSSLKIQYIWPNGYAAQPKSSLKM